MNRKEVFTSFTGKRTVVIGGSSGIGLATAKLITDLDGEVTVASRTAADTATVTDKLGSLAQAVNLDATKQDQVEAFFESVGPFDHLVCSSGRVLDTPFLEASPEQLRHPWEVKYWQYVFACRYGAPHMRRGGSIVLIGGSFGQKPGKSTSQASAINAAVEGLTRALAVELAPRGIRANTIAPGFVDTPMWDKLPAEAVNAIRSDISRNLPARVLGSSEEFGRFIVTILASPFATGSVFEVNGGSKLV